MGATIAFGANVSIISGTWTDFKTVALAKVLSIQYTSDSNVYSIFTVDGSLAYVTKIWQGTVPDGVINGGYSQSQNDTDKSDFETNYKPYANGQIDDNELDPRLLHRFGNATTTATTEVLVSQRPYAEPASQAQRSVVSTSAQDASAGTGAKAVRITYLTNNYVLKTEDITLNGTTAVNTVGTDIQFIEKFQVINGNAAAGAVKLMTTTAGGGTEICGINAATEDAFLSHHYVPAGKRAWILGWGATISNNANFKLKGQQRFGANLIEQNLDLENLTITSPNLPEFYRLFQAAIPIGEKCYIRITTVPGQVQSTVERSQLDLWEDVK